MPLKTRNQFPPGGWVYVQPETGWKAPRPKIDSFSETVKKTINHRRNNPGKGMNTDAYAVERDLDDFTCHRLDNDPKWCSSTDVYSATTQPKNEDSECSSCGGAKRAKRNRRAQ